MIIFIKSIVLVFNNVLSDEILIEKRFYIYSYWGVNNPVKSLCEDKHIVVRFIKDYNFCF